jgi:hypothetical protein
MGCWMSENYHDGKITVQSRMTRTGCNNLVFTYTDSVQF